MASVLWTVEARADLQDLLARVARSSPMYAMTLTDEFDEISDMLTEFPRIGRMVPELGAESVREVIVGAHRLIYRLEAPDLRIVAIIHGSRDLMRALRGREV